MSGGLVMKWSRVTWIGGVCLLLLSGCSESEPDTASNQPIISVFAEQGGDGSDPALRTPGDDAGTPTIRSVRFEPAKAVSGTRIRAVVDVQGEWTSIDYKWDVNGRPFGGSVAEVLLPAVAVGDKVSVRAVPIRGVLQGEPVTASVQANNQVPFIVGLEIERVDSDPDDRGAWDNDVPAGEMWRASVRTEDSDGDDVRIEYRWIVNGVPTRRNEEFFPVADLRSGDRLEVDVRAFDGQGWSATVRSGAVELGNSPPEIVSIPPRPDAAGYFRYTIRVEDPDGDQDFQFELREAPEGMQIDDRNGIVTWRPNTEQAGRHSVEIAVTDSGGAESTQSFSLALVARTDDPVPAAAR